MAAGGGSLRETQRGAGFSCDSTWVCNSPADSGAGGGGRQWLQITQLGREWESQWSQWSQAELANLPSGLAGGAVRWCVPARPSRLAVKNSLSGPGLTGRATLPGPHSPAWQCNAGSATQIRNYKITGTDFCIYTAHCPARQHAV